MRYRNAREAIVVEEAPEGGLFVLDESLPGDKCLDFLYRGHAGSFDFDDVDQERVLAAAKDLRAKANRPEPLPSFERSGFLYVFPEGSPRGLRGLSDDEALGSADVVVDLARGLVVKNRRGPTTAEADAGVLA